MWIDIPRPNPERSDPKSQATEIPSRRIFNQHGGLVTRNGAWWSCQILHSSGGSLGSLGDWRFTVSHVWMSIHASRGWQAMHFCGCRMAWILGCPPKQIIWNLLSPLWKPTLLISTETCHRRISFPPVGHPQKACQLKVFMSWEKAFASLSEGWTIMKNSSYWPRKREHILLTPPPYRTQLISTLKPNVAQLARGIFPELLHSS